MTEHQKSNTLRSGRLPSPSDLLRRSLQKENVASRVRAEALANPARLYAFDLLAISHRDLRGLPLIERKAHLRDAFEDTATLVFVNDIVGAGEWVFVHVCAHDFEGVLGKRLDSLYQRGRSHDWQKVNSRATVALRLGVRSPTLASSNWNKLHFADIH